MKKLIAAALLVSGLAACRTTTTSSTAVAPAPAGNQTGAPDPASALRGFLGAAKTPDLQAMSAYFGDRDGSARDRIPRDELEKRELIMASCLKYDRYDVVGDAPAQNGGRTFAVLLTKPGKSATVNFDVVRASDARWYVQQFDITKLMADYCRR
jgi:hypothetical protein